MGQTVAITKVFVSRYDLTHILWLLSKSLVHWPNKESQGKRKRTPNDQREKHCRPGEYMYYISKQTSERRDHFHHHRQCNEVQHILQLELDRAQVKPKKGQSSQCLCFKGVIISDFLHISHFLKRHVITVHEILPNLYLFYLLTQKNPTKTVHLIMKHQASINWWILIFLFNKNYPILP